MPKINRRSARSKTRIARQCPDAPAGVALFGFPGADAFVRAWATSPEGHKWAQASGVTLTPMDCSSAPGVAVGPVVISITSPAEGATLAGNVPIVGTVSGELDKYEVTWGRGQGNGTWEWISGPHLSPVENGPLTEWNVADWTRASTRCASWLTPNRAARHRGARPLPGGNASAPRQRRTHDFNCPCRGRRNQTDHDVKVVSLGLTKQLID